MGFTVVKSRRQTLEGLHIASNREFRGQLYFYIWATVSGLIHDSTIIK